MQKSTEHSETIKEQSNSVVSIEDAADQFSKRLIKIDFEVWDKENGNDNVSIESIFEAGAKFRDEQYNSLLNSYRELLEMVKTVQPFFQEDAPIGTAIENALKQSNNILKQFNQ